MGRPYKIPELAKKIGFDSQKLRRWLLRANEAQPHVGGIVKGPNGWMVSSVAKLAEYDGWGAVAKRFVSEDDATKLQERVRDQDKQIQSLRARIGAAERSLKIVVEFIERGTKQKLDEISVSEPLARASRTSSG